MARAPVRLNIYDMYWINDYASTVGMGVFHSGIEVYGVEYAYGGHPFSFSGIFENTPRDANELGEQFTFREGISLGETDFSPSDVRKLVQTLGLEYRGDKYHLIAKNCNHFTAALAKTLTGQDIPNWVNRLASISGSIPFLERWIPQEWLTPIALQESLAEKSKGGRSNGINHGIASLAVNTPLDDAREVFEDASSPGVRKKLIPVWQNGQQVGTSAAATCSTEENRTNTNPWRWFPRRGSADVASRSAPSTARPSSNNPSPSLSRYPQMSKIWNSFKGITCGDTSSSPSTSRRSESISSQNSVKSALKSDQNQIGDN
ncbi:PPPDE putative peptidase domain-containing protein [Ditylenchus destructor]|uniref:PPPDE putative peptidase domain-containing protein n=1 Tax=Ditylenchus destructor TaxID=166010 RepID=A0AAD4N8E7_9BILA|nr:PPPDE putative peptidase domain-containing protein [Ditylenchus destructor]